jgi:hypothetical protein
LQAMLPALNRRNRGQYPAGPQHIEL